jgi:hypothetical protein
MDVMVALLPGGSDTACWAITAGGSGNGWPAVPS